MNKILELLRSILPPLPWQLPVAVLLGALAGMAIFILHISKAPSYLSDDPKVCMNCHIMAPEYASWEHSSHANVTNCNACHTPQDNIINHYFFKAKDGLRHSFMYTFRMEPPVIHIHEAGHKVVEENCRRCHGDLISTTHLVLSDDKRSCVDCHREVPHGKVRGLSSVPGAIVPTTGSMLPQTIRSFIR